MKEQEAYLLHPPTKNNNLAPQEIQMRYLTYIAAILLLTSTQAHAQSNKKSNAAYTTIYLPDFFQYQPTKHGDTTFKYECYTRAHKQIQPDVLINVNDIDEIHYLKCYFQYPYKPGAVISPPYICPKEYIYAKTSDSTWYGKDMHTLAATGYIEHKTNIIRTDTVPTPYSTTNAPQTVIHKYYKTERVPASSVPAPAD